MCVVHPFTRWDDLRRDRHEPKKLQQVGQATTFVIAVARPRLRIGVSVIVYGESLSLEHLPRTWYSQTHPRDCNFGKQG